MKNWSIRTKILVGVVLVNLVGAIVVAVYMHQAYTGDLDAATERTAIEGAAAWEQLKGIDAEIDPLSSPDEIQRILTGMRDITGTEYGYLVEKSGTTPEAYSDAREAIGQPSNWDEGDNYAVLFATEGAETDRMQFSPPSIDVPEMGKSIGIENGACSKLCHETIAGEGDYWVVRWSSDSSTRAHGVFPVLGASGEPVGVIYEIDDISAQADKARSSMLETLAVIGITLLVSTVLIGTMINSFIFRRLSDMISSIEEISFRVAGGDFDAHFEPDGTTDEIGSFEQFFSDLIGLFASTLKSLTQKDD